MVESGALELGEDIDGPKFRAAKNSTCVIRTTLYVRH
jgi:hypothetical protein